MTLANIAGTIHNFDGSQKYEWQIVGTTGGINFASGQNENSAFRLSLDNFNNDFDGTFSLNLEDDSKDLFLVYSPNDLPLTPVPEPQTVVMVGLGFAGLFLGRRFLRLL